MRLKRFYSIFANLLLIAGLLAPLHSVAQMEFVENKGQWHSNVDFRGDFKTGSFFLEPKGFTVLMHNADEIKNLGEIIHGHSNGPNMLKEQVVLNSHAYKVKFLGSTNAKAQPDKPLPTYNNYFLGADPAKWAENCRIFTAVTYKNIYPNIDLRYYSTTDHLKYDFIIHPGGNPSMIALQYDGAQVSVKNKELIITTPVGEMKELYPYSYQSLSGKRAEVDVNYQVRNNVVTFNVKKYDPSQTLVIDPSVIFSTFTGSAADNWGYTATPGPDGSFFAGGIAFGSGYPTSPGAFQSAFGGGSNEDNFAGYDIAIFRFSPNGSNRLYATYIGGSGNEQPHSMIADGQGNLVVAGRSSSSNFPVTRPLIGPGGGYDIVITKLNSSGTAMIGSIKMGGSASDGVNIRPKWTPPSGPDATRRNYGDDARSEVILDNAGNIILASCTQSSNFPMPAGSPIQATFGGGRQDGVILKFNQNLSAQLFGTFFGGSGDDACFVASIHPITGNLYIAGGTTSTTLPGLGGGVMTPTFQGGPTDGFITQLLPDGSGIISTTYQGTTGIDMIYGLKFDRAGFPYIMGTSTGNWPVLNAAYSNPGSRQFITKLQPDLSAHIYSTVFGTAGPQPNISPVAFLVDRCENVYVSGWGGGINSEQNYSSGNTSNLPEVSPLPGIPAADGADFYFFVLEKNASSQLFGSHYGQFGGTGDHVDGGTSRFDENGVIYQAICANCFGGGNFPTTPGTWSPQNGSQSCNEAAVKIEMNFAGVGSEIRSSINGVPGDTLGCIPLEINFSDSLQQGQTYYWNFGDGSPVQVTSSPQISHTFTNVGSYTVMLISEDSTTCNIRDTSFITIRASDNIAGVSFTSQKLAPCESLRMQFTNTSNAGAATFGPASFIWDYGDGSPLDTAGFSPPRIHEYAAPGTYIVKLTLIDDQFCNAPQEFSDTIRISPLVKAVIATDSVGCAPYTVQLGNESLAGTGFQWDFGDGSPVSNEFEPVHTFNEGTYTIRLIASDPNTCNLIDTTYFTIRVYPKPTAAFTWSPDPPQENTPTQFTNQSLNSNAWLWDFGDGTTSTDRDPVHQFNTTGTFNVALVAFNAAGCTDTARLDVPAVILPLLDVPNAFTPGKFGVNSIVSVMGFGIGKMNWTIYNRWGQVMFRTQDPRQGWDGTFKGKLQPMDVYSYTLDVEFTDGQKLRKTGDITLLR